MFSEQTQAYCNSCRSNHPARLYEADNKIWGAYDCPQNGNKVHEISTDAGTYKTIRSRCFVDVTKTKSNNFKTMLHVIPITDACNFNCAACSMNAKASHNANYLSVEEITQRADLIKADGGKFVNLFGGEPTLHPKLFDILEALKKYRFNVGMPTNGLVVGRNHQFAKDMKRHGLTRISIQFDSLHAETLKKFGRSHLKEKRQAISQSMDAGLFVALNCLVTQDNLDELPELIQFAADLPANLFMLALISCAPIGHLAIDPEKLVGREEMIHKIIGRYDGFSINLNDFAPIPSFLPWGLEGHPDCSATARFIKDNGKISPVLKYIDTEKLFKKTAESRWPPGFFSKNIVPLVYLIASMRKGRSLDVLSLAWRYFRGKGNVGFLNIGTTNYKSAEFQDMNKISRCQCKMYTSQGPVIGSQYFFRDETFPGSRLNEQKKGAL